MSESCVFANTPQSPEFHDRKRLRESKIRHNDSHFCYNQYTHPLHKNETKITYPPKSRNSIKGFDFGADRRRGRSYKSHYYYSTLIDSEKNQYGPRGRVVSEYLLTPPVLKPSPKRLSPPCSNSSMSTKVSILGNSYTSTDSRAYESYLTEHEKELQFIKQQMHGTSQSIEYENYIENYNEQKILSKIKQKRKISFGLMCFLLGFILLPFWWVGSVFPKHFTDENDKTWKMVNSYMSVYSVFVVVLLIIIIALSSSGVI
ncbi:hypothetical protein BB560_004279 [Smittium megazygosporum]|uniref:Uncharacterized protein n=1 Tax=Smittium megazygosporum TaxID=133381 RepID=A0A2T9Z9S4_9FUNG|nr:hypothetical protein BB560_004279 [Smittium megazygosporum]